MIRIGPAGNSLSFYESGKKHTYQAAEWLHGLGLNAFEYSFGRGISISAPTAAKIKHEFDKNDVQISAHAPYYVNFASPNPDMIEKSFGYIDSSIAAVQAMGGNRVVFHPASLGGRARGEVLADTLRNIERLVAHLHGLGLRDFILCAETMGKHGQLGTVEEIVEICRLADCLYPCVDFGHVNSYTLGGIKCKDDYRRIIDLLQSGLGDKKTAAMHIHFSKIMYGKSGEIKHLTFADTEFGPEYPPLASVIDEYGLSPVIICESDGTMAEDALAIKSCHKQNA